MSCIECVNTSEVKLVERLGKYNRMLGPGFSVVCWPIESVVGTVSLRVQSLDVRCETKTFDNVFVDTTISVQFAVIQEKTFDAYYKMERPTRQIESYVQDAIRSTMPTFTLDKVFEAKDEIALTVKAQLSAVMESYGYTILNTLVTEMSPDPRVRSAMNEINTSRRLKEAASEKAEGDKILVVKSAEAEAESKYLSGVGVARQRKAIVDGLRDSISAFAGNVQGTNAKDVIDLLLMTQYFDMLKDIGGKPGCNTVFIPEESD